jgi:F1F0 ATPase subunit 2
MDAQAMTAFHLSAHDLAFAAAWLAAGLVIGAIHFLSLRWNVRMLAADRSMLLAAAVQFGRFVALGILLAVIARTFGAFPLLAGVAGIVTARTLIVRREA